MLGQFDPISGLVSAASQLAVAGVRSKAAGDIARREARASVMLAQQQKTHLEGIAGDWRVALAGAGPLIALAFGVVGLAIVLRGWR